MKPVGSVLLLIMCYSLYSPTPFLFTAATFEVAEVNEDAPSCPNAQYSGNSGPLQSPNWPNFYGNNEDCVYFITAAPGFVAQIRFWSFDTELCCDYLDLFDGPDFVNSVKIGRLSGVIAPSSYAASSRWLSMQFITDPIITRPGFNASYYSTSTAYPCNRDVFISMDGHSTLGTEENYHKELQFVANTLVANWSIGHNLTQVVPALMETDEMTSYDFNEIGSLAELQHDILAYGSKSIKGEDPDALEAVFYLIEPRITDDLAYKNGARKGIDRILVLFLSFMPNDDSDLKGSIRYADRIKAEGTKIAIVGMGPDVDVSPLAPLSSGPKYLFTAKSYDDLNSNLAEQIKQVICLQQ